jgi:hypothetical protein
MVSNTEQTTLEFSTKELFNAFNAYTTTSKFKYEINIVKFGVRLTNLKLKGIETVKGRDYNSKKNIFLF